jgi:V/A-type H+-transporting ATPase subunit E
MTDSKLQELIETLKKQGIESGEEASKKIIEEAQREAGDIKAKARAEANRIKSQAQEESDSQMKQLQSSLEIAASQFVTSLKRVIEENLLAIPFKEKLTEALGDLDFLKELLKIVVQAYIQHGESNDVAIFLPEEQREKLHDYAMELISTLGGKEEGRLALTLHSGNMDVGFMISRGDGGMRLDFSDDAFLAYFLQFLTPKFRKLFQEVKLGELAGR